MNGARTIEEDLAGKDWIALDSIGNWSGCLRCNSSRKRKTKQNDESSHIFILDFHAINDVCYVLLTWTYQVQHVDILY